MKIYLDIDGTMIHEDLSDRYLKAAEGLEEFLIALRSYDTYWLTTHCTEGDPSKARTIMKNLLPNSFHHDIDRIKPTVWKDFKTTGIDFNSDFIWFDNDIYSSEWETLKHCNANQTVIEVNLRTNPRHLIEITRDILNYTLN